jgi:Yip1 domain
VLFTPRRFFDALTPDGPLRAPVLYFLICSATTALINTVAILAFFAVPAGIALATGSIEAGLLLRLTAIFVLASLVAGTMLFVVGFFVSVPIQHALILLVAGRNQKGLPATLRVSCYSVGAPMAVAWIPLAAIPAVFYCFYLHATGLKRVHRISTSRSLVATVMLTALMLVLATALVVYDYRLIQEAMG